MKLLLDTHLALCAFDDVGKLSQAAVGLIDNRENDLFFSALSIWETAIKSALHKKDFNVDAQRLRRGLLDNGYSEIPFTSEHAVMVQSLPAIHKDPFDRLLIAQATVEGVLLLTSDRKIAKYPGPIRRV